ncbi:MAG: ATP-dependent 6-phosphofructokinase [Armatimonadaceae bacterium]
MASPRFAVLTSGGDAPGMNAAVRSVVRTWHALGASAWAVRRGFDGLLHGDIQAIPPTSTDLWTPNGGTHLGTARSDLFRLPEAQNHAVEILRDNKIDGLVVIGGSGTQRGAAALHRLGLPVVGIASTIDNDLRPFDITLGADTAVNVALESIDRLRTTATSHQRVAVVEVMGRSCGYIAWACGTAAGADVIVAPEDDIAPDTVLRRLQHAWAEGKRGLVVVVAEGAKHGAASLLRHLGRSSRPEFEPRLTVLGHTQRGGVPTAFDRWLGARCGQHAAEALRDGTHGFMVGLRDGRETRIAYHEIDNYPRWDATRFRQASRYLSATGLSTSD